MGLVDVLVYAAVGLFFLVFFLVCCCKILPIWCGCESGIIEEEITNIPQNPPHLVASRATDPPSSQQQYINRDNRTVGAKRTQPPPDFGRPVNPILNKGVPSVLAGPELEKPSSAQGGYREGFTYSKNVPVPAEVCPNKKNPFHSCTTYCEKRWTPLPIGDNNKSERNENKTKNQEELSQQERREDRLNGPQNFGRPVNPIINRGSMNNQPVPSAPAVIELENPRSSWGEIRYVPHSHMQTGEPTELTQQERREGKLNAPVPSAPAVLELERPKSSQGGQTCCVCMNQTVEIIFNCGHAATCAECSQSLCACPICRSDITSRNRIYLSGI